MIDFYLEYLRLNEENNIQREKHLNRITKQFLKGYNTTLNPKIEFNTNQNELGNYDPYENKLKVFNIDFITKNLQTKICMK